nr:NB-ARC domains-containing protein [Tanacetum cinerariifolium]
MKKKCNDKGSKERSPPYNLRQKPSQYICYQNHKDDFCDDGNSATVNIKQHYGRLENEMGKKVKKRAFDKCRHYVICLLFVRNMELTKKFEGIEGAKGLRAFLSVQLIRITNIS